MAQEQKLALTQIERDFSTPIADSLSLELSLQNLRSIRQSMKFRYQSDVLGLFDAYENKDSIYVCNKCGCSIDNKEVYSRLIEHQMTVQEQEKKYSEQKEEKKKKENEEKKKKEAEEPKEKKEDPKESTQFQSIQQLINQFLGHLVSHLNAIRDERKKLTTGLDGKPKRPPHIIFRVNTVIDTLEEQINLLEGSQELLGSVGSQRKDICSHQKDLHKKIIERAIYVNHDAIELFKKLQGFS